MVIHFKCFITYLDLQKTLSPLSLLRMIEPGDLDNHVAPPGLPQTLNAANVG